MLKKMDDNATTNEDIPISREKNIFDIVIFLKKISHP